MRKSMCPSVPDYPAPIVRAVSCDNCGTLAVFPNGETPEGWLIKGGALLCPVCRREERR